MFCTQCGTEAQASARFCRECGSPLTESAPVRNVPVTPDAPSANRPVNLPRLQVETPPTITTWRCPQCRRLNKPGTALCVCGHSYGQARTDEPSSFSTYGGPHRNSPSEIIPTFTGRGTDIFSAKGLKMMLWYVSLVGIPVGWIYTLRWVVENTKLPGGPALTFNGTAQDAYGYFVIMIAMGIVNRQDPSSWEMFSDTDPALLGMALLIVWVFLLIVQGFVYWHLYRWVCAGVVSTSGTRLEFVGRAWPYVGWTVLQILSIFTIIGWAWVQTAFLRWQFKRTRTPTLHLGFRGSGLGFLWRAVGATAASVLIIPLPWMVAYMYGWIVGNIEVHPLLPQPNS